MSRCRSSPTPPSARPSGVTRRRRSRRPTSPDLTLDDLGDDLDRPSRTRLPPTPRPTPRPAAWRRGGRDRRHRLLREPTCSSEPSTPSPEQDRRGGRRRTRAAMSSSGPASRRRSTVSSARTRTRPDGRARPQRDAHDQPVRRAGRRQELHARIDHRGRHAARAAGQPTAKPAGHDRLPLQPDARLRARVHEHDRAELGPVAGRATWCPGTAATPRR